MLLGLTAYATPKGWPRLRPGLLVPRLVGFILLLLTMAALLFEAVNKVTRWPSDDLYVMNADGSGVTRLTNVPANHSRPSWSPDATSTT